MSKLAYGPASWHVLASRGPPVYPLHFYSTNYSTQHGREGYTGGVTVRHRGTGYASNFRPAVYYSPRLDAVDNPALGKLLQDNYTSRTRKDYLQYTGSDGRDPMPNTVHPGTSGFAHNLPKTTPTSRQATSVHVDTARNGSVPLYPHHSPLLHSLHQHKDPITTENAGHGPSSMSTEYHTKFPQQPFRDGALHSSTHSQKEESGFTHAHNVEPITFRPHDNFTGDLPGHMTWRPTGASVMKRNFRSPHYMKGSEPFQAVTGKTDRSNGYVKGNQAMADVQPKASEMVGYTSARQLHHTVLERVRREDPAEYSILTHPHQYASLTQRSFRGARWSTPSEAGRLGREEVGRRELTGFSENTEPCVEPRDKDSARFHTSYQQKFSLPSLPSGGGTVPSGRSGVHPPLSNGFSKSTQVHRFGASLDTARTLRENHPYVARSIMKRDPYFDDHTHDSKTHTSG